MTTVVLKHCKAYRHFMSFELKPATRQGVRPLIALYSESGCGKTFSSLLLARGFVGPSGKIAMIDTESGRGSLYADVLPGGYDVMELDPPFEPRRYCEAMAAVEASGASIGIIDSGSHEWEGAGGVLDMASAIEERTGKTGLHCWKEPKLAHGLWVRTLLRSKLAWIVCLRAKYKSRQTKNEHGKTVIVKDDHTSPIAAEDFIFEATAHAEILADHSIVLTKCSHPQLRACFPEKGPITVEHGRQLALWCAAGSALPPAGTVTPPATAPAAAPSTKQLMDRLWTVCLPIRGSSGRWTEALTQLRAWKILGEQQKLSSLSVEELQFVIEKTELAISQLEPVTP